MTRYELYQQTVEVPERHLRWNLYGAGMQNLGQDGKPELVLTPRPSKRQLLVRIDAVGICFSDLKIIRLGGEHPKIARNLQQHPVVMGHEIACTVAQVGSALTEQFQVGEHYIVQADVYVNGRVQAVGYALEGGYTQYALMTEPVLFGDAGCYLLKCPDHLTYAESALVEPWACVVASYQITPRPTPRAGKRWLIVLPHSPTIHYRCSALETLCEAQPKGIALIVHDARGNPLVQTFQQSAQRLGMEVHLIPMAQEGLANADWLPHLQATYTQSAGFDDILLFGNPTPALLERALDSLAYEGCLSFTCHQPLEPVPVDVGRLHYDRLQVMGTMSWDITDALRYTRSSALRGGDRLLLFGAGGPMGQMHLHYALSAPNPPAQVVVVDRHPERLQPLEAVGRPLAQARGIEFHLYCNADTAPEDQLQHLHTLTPHGYDQIMMMASSPEAIALAYPLLTDEGVLNLFAGIPKGNKIPLDLTPLATRHMRLMGSSGSTMDDIRRCLHLTATGELPTRKVLTAVGGLNSLHEAIEAVRTHRYLGKIVVYPHLPDLPLVGLQEMREKMPDVYAHIEEGRYWTREAESALFERYNPER